MTKEYVAGFAFKNNFKEVLLLHKKRPEWQAGSFNGVGGKIKIGEETSIQAMTREFEEEVGVFVPYPLWTHFCTIYGCRAAGKVIFFWTDYHPCIHAKMIEDEQPMWFNSNILPPNIINNLNWLIPMAAASLPVVAAVQEIQR